ncbi:MAG: hypothetical protein JXA77_11185 [Bacteroidales bacterium]|nr:hypothetical protein [Bacteroidales bacterium]MBN2819056.1 hypothetical protein [Bacteroidales bacterium]
MISHIQKTIADLKARIKQNVQVINNNQECIKSLIRQSDFEEKSEQFSAYNNQNKSLLTQNNDLINVQLTLMNFLDKYKDTAILREEIQVIDIYSITDIQEMFTLTIKGIIAFDNKHPYFNDSAFIDKLIIYYESVEDYERCQELISLKERILS